MTSVTRLLDIPVRMFWQSALKTKVDFLTTSMHCGLWKFWRQDIPGFPGLNLSHETLEGQQYRAAKQNETHSPSLEAQVVDAADSIAYDSHDADDALELGLLDVDQLQKIPIWQRAIKEVNEGTDLSPTAMRRAVVHELIDKQVEDLLRTSASNIQKYQPESAEEVKTLGSACWSQ